MAEHEIIEEEDYVEIVPYSSTQKFWCKIGNSNITRVGSDGTLTSSTFEVNAVVEHVDGCDVPLYSIVTNEVESNDESPIELTFDGIIIFVNPVDLNAFIPIVVNEVGNEIDANFEQPLNE